MHNQRSFKRTREPVPASPLREWFEPAVVGFELLINLVATRVIFGIPFLAIALWRYGIRVLVMLAWVFVLASVAGAAAGIVFSILRPLRPRWPAVWAFLSGWACTGTY